MTFSTVSVNDSHLYGGAGGVLHIDQPVSFLLEFVHLTLVGQQAVVLEVLREVHERLKLQALFVMSEEEIPSVTSSSLKCLH